MAKRDPGEVYRALIAAGFDPAAATVMTEIAGGESSWNDSAVGDTSLENSTWGPSYGLFQIRTLKGQTGSGSDRDIGNLTGSVAAQAKAAFDISKGGTDFSPWTVYRTGRYKDFAGQVATAVGSAASSAASAAGTVTVGLWDTLTGQTQLLAGGRTLALQVGAGLLAVALIGAGFYTLARPSIKRANQKIDQVGRTLAVAAV